jgi:hypothetical protein
MPGEDRQRGARLAGPGRRLAGRRVDYALDGKRYQFMLGETVLEDLAARPGETVTLTVVGTNGAQRDVEVTLRDAAAIAAKQGALGVKASPGGFEIYWSGEYAQNDPATALSTGGGTWSARSV